jgi:hypothetical protein
MLSFLPGEVEKDLFILERGAEAVPNPAIVTMPEIILTYSLFFAR